MAKKKDYTWVKVYRDLQNHWLWQDKPFSRGQAWVDLIMLAKYTGEPFYDGKGRLIHGKRGTVYRSIEELSQRWGWGNKKTRVFLDDLEHENMIKVNKKQGSDRTTVTIVNYSKFQDSGTSQGTTQNLSQEQVRNKSCTSRAHIQEGKRKSQESSKKEKEPAPPVSPKGDPAAADDVESEDDIGWIDPSTLTDEEKERWIHDGHL